MTATDRSGFSLMEVLLATAILLGSVIVLGELAAIGRQHANSAEELATAQRLCQNKLNEILAGLTSLEPVEAEPLEMMLLDEEIAGENESAPATESEGEPTWLHSVEIEPSNDIGLVAVRVTVWLAEYDEHAVEEDDDVARRGAFSLVRWMRDPFADETQAAGLGAPGQRSFP